MRQLNDALNKRTEELEASQARLSQQAADRAHQLVGLLGRIGRPAATLDQAVPSVIVEHAQRDLVERGPHRGDLVEDIDAVALVLDHLVDPADLAFDSCQPRLELFLRR